MRSDLALAALASAAVPGMKPVAVAGIAVDEPEAEHQQAVVEDATGRRWLVRSPLTALAGARLQRNDELVRQLSRHLPFKVPAAVGYAVVGPEGRAAVYPHVEGMTLDLANLPAGTGLAHAVGRAVAAIHNIPRAAFEQQDVPVFDASGARQRVIAEVDRAAETGRVPTRLLARWEEAFDAAPLWQFATTPVHGAFRGSTVLVAFADDEAASGRVVAVTDWEEAMISDPATDLAELYARASPEAWESVLDSYVLARAQRPDPYLHARARLVSETRRLRGLALAVGEGDEERTRRIVDALRRMDRLTEDEDSLVPTTARPAAAAQSRGGAVVPPAETVPERPTVADPLRPDDSPTGPVAAGSDTIPDTGGDETADDAPEAILEDPDVTAEVPAPVIAEEHPTEGTTTDDDEPPTVDEPPTADAPTDEDELPTEEAPPTAMPAPTAPAAADTADDDVELDSEGRLHELYGMPVEPGADSAEESAPTGDDAEHEGEDPRP